MNHEHLHQLLAALRAEITTLTPEQSEQHQKLTDLLTALEDELKVEHSHGLAARVSQVLTQFETEHPHLTEVVNRVSLLLSNMGL